MSGVHGRHGDAYVQDSVYGVRGLRRYMPSLPALLSPGQRVLDVGCGPGSITLDVAMVIEPGEVVGVDAEESSVLKATAAAVERHIANAKFIVGNVYELPFETDRFDLVYAHRVLQWLREPERAVRQMMKVTKDGGVVAVQDQDAGTTVAHPAMPNFLKWIRAREFFNTIPEADVYGRAHFGRQLYAVAVAAGLQDVKVEPYVTVACADPEELKSTFESMTRRVHLDGPWEKMNRRLLQEGLVTEALLAHAAEELKAWYADPNAFAAQAGFLVHGTVRR